MPLSDEERAAIVGYRFEKAQNTLIEAQDCASMGHWSLAANRLYYSVFYAASALLIHKGLSAKTHEGATGLIGQHFVKTGILSKEDGALLARLQSMRHTGDYDDFMEWTCEDVEPNIEKVKYFLLKVRDLLSV